MSEALLKIGIGGAIVLAALIWHQIDRNAASADGQRNERVIWQERQARADLKAEQDRKTAQAAITRIEIDYGERVAAEGAKATEFRKALENEKAAGRACAAITRELRDKLNAIGRRG